MSHAHTGHRVLVVEDDAALRNVLARGLDAQGFAVLTATNGAEAVRAATDATVDAVVLDIGLPDGDGRDVCAALRAQGLDIPVLFLTARGNLSDRLSGFACGGDDYLAKPFAFPELLARLRALLHRSSGPERAWGGLVLDPTEFTLACGEHKVALSPTEFRLLAKLLSAPGKIATRLELTDTAWPAGATVSGNTLDHTYASCGTSSPLHSRHTRSRRLVASATASPEPRRVRRTLRGRVSLIGLCVIGAWVLLLTTTFWLVMRSRLHSERDALLHDRAAAAADTIYITSTGKVNVLEHSGDEELDSGIWIFSGRQVIDRPAGGVKIQQAAAALAGHGARFGVSTKYRLYAQPVTRGGKQVGTVVATSSNTPYEHALAESVEGSIVVAILVLVGAYPVLRFAAGRALRPVDEMTRQAGHWSAHALTERFGPDQRFREVQSLATTLDGVLDRLAAVVRHERRLSGELSHELRTPLARIVAETYLLLDRTDVPEDAKNAHAVIQHSATSMTQILETLLDTALLDVIVTPGRCDLEPVIKSLITTYADTSRQGCLPQIRFDIGDDIGVGVDASIVQRVLAPIIDNARRYATESVTIVAQRTSDSVLIDICDDGPGVPTALREAIFEPGWRGQPDDGHRGAGLGLALSRRLARSGAGDVNVVGPDSRFRVRMPPA